MSANSYIFVSLHMPLEDCKPAAFWCRSQARVNGGGGCGRKGIRRKTLPQGMDMWTNRRPDLARASLGSDAQRNRRDSARSGLRLLHQEQVRLKKIVQRRRKRQAREKEREEVRVMKMGTLNVGSMTGRGHEIVEFMKRRAVRILCGDYKRPSGTETKQKNWAKGTNYSTQEWTQGEMMLVLSWTVS